MAPPGWRGAVRCPVTQHPQTALPKPGWLRVPVSTAPMTPNAVQRVYAQTSACWLGARSKWASD